MVWKPHFHRHQPSLVSRTRQYMLCQLLQGVYVGKDTRFVQVTATDRFKQHRLHKRVEFTVRHQEARRRFIICIMTLVLACQDNMQYRAVSSASLYKEYEYPKLAMNCGKTSLFLCIVPGAVICPLMGVAGSLYCCHVQLSAVLGV